MPPPLPRLIFRTLIAIAALVLLILIAITLYVRQSGGLLAILAKSQIGPLSPAVLYPPAPPMPAPVSTPIADLLAQYEQLLKDRAPAVLVSLQPGLSDAQIDALESKHHFKLTPDLRALYHWHNGTASPITLDAFPDHQFIPLDQAAAERDTEHAQLQATPAATALLAYRDPWLGLIVDPAGDGHFFDPTRSESQGSFFFNFAEDGTYLFFPAFRNYLAALLQGVPSDTFTFGPRGAETKDFQKAQTLFLQFAASPRP